jgi:hypothetical protein
MLNMSKMLNDENVKCVLRLRTTGKSPFGDSPEEIAFRAYLCWAQFPGE